MIYLEKRVFPAKGDTLIFFTFEDGVKKNGFFEKLDKLTKGAVSRKLDKYSFTGKKDEQLILETGGPYEQIIVYGAGREKELTPAVLRDLLANATRIASSIKASDLSIFWHPELGQDFFELGKAMALGFHLAQYRFDKYKGSGEKKKVHQIKDLHVCFEGEIPADMEKGMDLGKILAESISFARDLVNEPASHLYPEALVREAFAIEKESKGKIKVQVLDKDECERLGMGAFLGVAQGSLREPRFIVLEYNPAGKNSSSAKASADKAKTVCLIGKSITFDSGGISIKPSQGMEEMKSDMAGGASVLGVFRTLARCDLISGKVYGILPACENMPSGGAIKPGDVVTALNGKTAEVINTDAEGRLALADAVAYAEKHLKPDEIIDLATLTGACKVALGDDIAGLFGNDKAFNRRFLESARQEGEQVWELPLHKQYLPLLKSNVADIKNITGKGWGGAITGALFIGEFLKNTKWIHIDIAGPSYITHGPEGIVATGGTGWGILSIINLLSRI